MLILKIFMPGMFSPKFNVLRLLIVIYFWLQLWRRFCTRTETSKHKLFLMLHIHVVNCQRKIN